MLVPNKMQRKPLRFSLLIIDKRSLKCAILLFQTFFALEI
jgi:hypothetical protein